MFTIEVDKEGFLKHLQDWSPEVANTLARQEDISLTRDHWEIIDLVRAYYKQYRISPAARIIVRLLQDNLEVEKGSSIYLMQLFTGRPARMVNKIAGLPKPANCD